MKRKRKTRTREKKMEKGSGTQTGSNQSCNSVIKDKDTLKNKNAVSKQ